MLNSCIIMGRLVRDPELRRTGSGTAVASFTLAVDRDYSKEEKKTDFINCVAWRQTGEFVSKYFAKGRMMVADGRLEMREWTDKDDNKRISAEVIVENAYFGDSKKEDSGTQGGYPAPTPNSHQSYQAPQAYAPMDGDDPKLPF